MASELKPCAHCGGAAELDYEQPFCAFPSGKMEKQVAIYCTECDVHMNMCYSDFPEYDHDQMAAILTEKWNTRPTPVAPVSPDATGKCGELVTVGFQYKFGDVWLVSDAPKVMRKAGYELREVVTRENAEAVIVNVEAEKAKAIREAGKHFAKTCMMAEEIETLKAARSQAEELEMVRIEKRLVSPYPQFWVSSYLPPDRPFDKYWTDPENGKQYEHRALVTRSQAEELLAAEIRRERDLAAKQLSEVVDRMSDDYLALKDDNAAKDAQIERFRSDRAYTVGFADGHDAAEVDNAALTARVKELEKDVAKREEHRGKLMKGYRALEAKLKAANGRIEALVQSLAYETSHEATKRSEALEAKLAAVEKSGVPHD